MKIGYSCPFNNLGCGESEARIRYTYCLEKLGHSVISLDVNNFSFDNKDHGDNLNLDFIIFPDIVKQLEITPPDVFSVFKYWTPPAFLPGKYSSLSIEYLNKYDCIVGGYDTESAQSDIDNSLFFDYSKLLPCYSSVPRDFSISAKKNIDRNLFYVGMNVEADFGNLRHGKLLKFLDTKKLISIYGAKKHFGYKNWKGFKCYKGEIPFDGKSIIKEMNNAGIVLALHHPIHNLEGYVSNRLFEAAAAGAVIISDENEFVRKYFSDTVYYIDIKQSEEEQNAQILKYLEEINLSPDKAYRMAKRSQEIFLEKFALDDQIENLIEFVKHQKEKFNNLSKKTTVDAFCFFKYPEEFISIQGELEKQIYRNIHLILITSKDTYTTIKKLVKFDHSFVEAEKDKLGEQFIRARDKVKGEYFVFMNGYSALHKNHIYKAVSILDKCEDSLFSYSGTYIRNEQEDNKVANYQTLNKDPLYPDKLIKALSMDEFYDFEEKFAMASIIFRRKVLDYFVDYELKNISIALHIYSVLKVFIKSGGHNRDGIFLYTLSSGYRLGVTKVFNSIFAENRKFITAKDGKMGHSSLFEVRKVIAKYQVVFLDNNLKSDNLAIVKKYIMKIINRKLFLKKLCFIFSRSVKLKKRIETLENELSILRLNK
jgi:hypothetical protein